MYGEQMTRWQRFMQRFQLSPVDVVEAELKDAQVAALQAISKSEYATLRANIYSLTAKYHHERSVRLLDFLTDVSEPTKE